MYHSRDIEDKFIDMLGRVWPVIMYVFRRNIGHDELLEKDYVQDVKMILWMVYLKAEEGDLEFKESTLTYIIAENVVRQLMRDMKKHGMYNSGHYNDAGGTMVIEGEEAENRVYLGQLMDCLREDEKKILMMLVEGNSYREIAHKTGKSENSITSFIHRIRTKLKKLTQYEK